MNPAERTLSYTYDKLGNLRGRTSTVGTDHGLSGASFGEGTSAPGPNALTGVTIGGDAYTLRYDRGGKVLGYDDTAEGDDTLIGWNGRSLPETIDVASDAGPVSSEAFAYGPDGRRYHRKSVWKDGSATRTEHSFYAGAFEERLLDGHAGYASVQKTRVGAGIVQVRTLSHPDPANKNKQTAASSLEYLHRDHLGSVEAVTDATGARLATLAYDPFGARRKADWTRSLNSGEIETLADDLKLKISRGYSDHEHLDRAGFIHMNGRVYDPRTGRFLSPDPVVEDPAFSQSWHSYSYVANSPLSLADPTGLFAQCPIPTLGFSCDPAASPGGFGGAVDTIFSFIHRYWFDFYVYRAPSFGLAIGDEGLDLEFDVVDLIGVAVSVVSEVVAREMRAEGQTETDESMDIVVIIRVPWQMPTEIPEGSAKTTSPEKYEAMKKQSPYVAVEVSTEKRSEIERVLSHPVFAEESQGILRASVRHKAELGALRIYREGEGTYGVYSVGTPKTRTSMDVGRPNPELGEHIFDLHVHPHESLAKSVPSPSDLRTSFEQGAPGVILYPSGFLGRGTGTTIYQGACTVNGDC